MLFGFTLSHRKIWDGEAHLKQVPESVFLHTPLMHFSVPPQVTGRWDQGGISFFLRCSGFFSWKISVEIAWFTTFRYNAKILKGFPWTNLLFWNKFILFGKNWFLLEINMLISWKDFCWPFLFSVLEKIYFCPNEKIFLFRSKLRQKRVIFYQ